jgi:CHAT domain-containing protein
MLRTVAALQEQVRQAELDREGDSSAAGTIRFLNERLARARRAYEELALRVGEIESPATTLLGSSRVGAPEVLGSLEPGEVLLEYLPAGDSLLVFVARHEDLRATTVALPKGGLAPRVRLARELIADRGRSAARARPVLRSLDQLLIEPARRLGALAAAHTLVVVPHGVLAYLPFAALIDSAGGFLVQRAAVVTLPSAGALAALRRRGGPHSTSGAEVLAPDPDRLPATAVEAATVGRALSASVRIGRAASEQAVRSALASGAVVHLAAHAELNPRNPMFSWIQTAPAAPGEDGRLEVHEILGLRVRSPLVFLSGCETGLGTVGGTSFAQGEDFATLARAFLYAGARNVVATLWRVDDQGAAAFAAEYYRHLSAAGPAGALAGAQRALAGDQRWGAPYYWAGYSLAGEALGPDTNTSRGSYSVQRTGR